MNFRKDVVMFVGPENDEVMTAAKGYIKQMKLTNKDVIMVKSAGQILVKAIRDFD